MPVTRFERSSEVDFGVAGALDNRTVSWLAEGTDPGSGSLDEEVMSHARSNSPSSWDGIPRSDIRIRQILPLVYRVDAIYSSSSPKALAETSQTAEASFSYGTANERVLYSLETVGKFPETADDFDRAIGVEGDGQNQVITGADALRATGRRTIAFTAEQATLTMAYESVIENLAGKTNAAAFMGREVGEVLFLGARGSTSVLTSASRTAKTNARLLFDFEVKQRLVVPASYTIAGIAITEGTVINPFDHVWVRYAKVKGVNGTRQKAVGVYIERMLEEGDFSALGIPDGVP